jgi:hypothetical protein
MDYQLYELSSAEFEGLVYNICIKILGENVSIFRKGKDGGRDARFEGKALNIPNNENSWEGKFIIQAKGEGDVKDSCNENYLKYFEKEEFPKILKLIEGKELDNYILFTSRRLTAGQDAKFRKLFNDNFDGINFDLYGREKITGFIERNPQIEDICNLKKIISPLRINPNDIKDTIVGFYSNRENVTEGIRKVESNFDYVSKETKNELNNLSEEYFKIIKERSLPFFDEIDNFLKDNKNKEFKGKYLDIVDELRTQIETYRDEYNKFDKIFSKIRETILNNSNDEIKEKRWINIFLHYMYWNCDIGRKEDD